MFLFTYEKGNSVHDGHRRGHGLDSMVGMKTVVVTRLAINPFSDRDLTVRGDERDLKFLDSSWLEARVALFKRFAMASMLNQVMPPDYWIIAVDSRIEHKLSSLRPELPPWAIWLVLAPDDVLSEALRSVVGGFARDVLSIRLDSDDMFSPEFIKVARLRSRPNRGINFPHGAQFIVPSGAVFHRWINSNPMVGFRSLDTDLHVHDFGNHPNVGRTVRMVSVPTISAMYLKASHGSNNVWFRPNGIPVIRRRRLLTRFGVDSVNTTWTRLQSAKLLVSYLGFLLNRVSPSLAKKLMASGWGIGRGHLL